MKRKKCNVSKNKSEPENLFLILNKYKKCMLTNGANNRNLRFCLTLYIYKNTTVYEEI